MQQDGFEAGILAGRAALRVAGPEATHFLHNLLTADIENLAEGDATYAALLTPQGKILFDMFVLRADEGFLLDCALAQREELGKRLGFYKLRAKVTVDPLPELEVAVSPERPDDMLRYRDPRVPDMGWRSFRNAAAGLAAEGYDAVRIATGLADSEADLAPGEFFPHEANLDQVGGVSFHKGCYIGQEVVSRMEHRGTARSRIQPVRVDGPVPAKGSEIRSGEKLVGTLLSSAGEMALALLRLDRLADAAAPLLVEGVGVEVLKPSWVRYDVPGPVALAR